MDSFFSKFLRLQQDSVRTVTGAILLCAMPCAATLYRFRAKISLDIFPILWIISSAFFTMVLIRQFLAFRPAETARAADDEERPGVAGLVAVVVVSGLAYARTIPLCFTSDDFSHLSLIRQPFSVSVWPQFTHGQAVANFYRPLGFASLFLDYRLWHTWAPGYHLINVAMHLCCVAALFFLCRAMQLNNQACTLAALFFGILPVNTQAVAWMGCRFDLLATLFMLWSLVFAAKFRKTRRAGAYIGTIAFFILAALTKESAYVLPLLWIALELLPLDGQQPSGKQFTRRLLPLLGYLAGAGLAFLQRWHVLGGIGGLRQSSGAQEVIRFGVQSLTGVLVRGPSAMLLGNNVVDAIYSTTYFNSSALPFLTLVVLTAAFLLAIPLLAIAKTSFRQTIWFSLIWIFGSIIPVHYYFDLPQSAVNNARVMYFGSAGMAILLSVLLNSASDLPKLRWGWAVAICVLLLLGLESNIGAWQSESESVRDFFADLKKVEPSPGPNTTFYIAGVPELIRGVPFFTCCLQEGVRFNYGNRADISAERLTDSVPASVGAQSNAVVMGWFDRGTLRPVLFGTSTAPEVVKIN